MKTIDVEGLPESVAHAVERVVETVRELLRSQMTPRSRVRLPEWPGAVIGKQSRSEIYTDVGPCA